MKMKSHKVKRKQGKKFANYWMHNGYVTIGEDDEKMSKSLGNFITVHEMIKNVDPQVLRFFMATTQYRRPIRYSETTMKEAATNLQRLKNTFDNLKFRKKLPQRIWQMMRIKSLC